MKTMIWKELRENFKWALLALVLLLLAQLYALSSGNRSGNAYSDYSLCGSTFLLATSFGYALAGAVLGALQILPELRRDQWAALLHRPVSRSTIFFGKVAAGLMLYAFATLIPLLVSVAFVAMPGQFAVPLVPGLLVPASSDLCFGAVFYFAALLICLHRGRWLGSRGAMGLALVPAFVLHVTNGWPFLFPLAAALIFLLAAWGAMLTNGPIREMPVAGKAACLSVIFAGAYAALLLAAWGLQSLQPKPSPYHATYTNFRVTRDGLVLLASQKGDGSDLTLTGVDGKPVTDERFLNREAHQNFLSMMPLVWGFKFQQDSNQEAALLRRRPRAVRNYVQAVERNGGGKESWYFLPEQKYFVGYDKLSRRRIGICDAKGFHPSGAIPEPFPGRLQIAFMSTPPLYLFWEGSQLYGIDFSERRMTPLFRADGERIISAVMLRNGKESPASIAIALKSGIRLIDQQGTPLGEAPYLTQTDWGYLTAGMNDAGDRLFLEYLPDFGARKPPSQTSLEVSDLHGRILESYSHDMSSGDSTPVTLWATEIVQHTLPPALALPGALIRKNSPPTLPIFNSASYPRPIFGVEMSSLPALLGVSGALAAVAFALCRRAGTSAGLAGRWALFVAGLGLPGFLAFVITADWPRRRKCPDCRNLRPVENDDCPHCRAAWRPPEKTGSEILEPIIPS